MSVYLCESLIHCLRAIPHFEETLRTSVYNPDSLAELICVAFEKSPFEPISDRRIGNCIIEIFKSLESDTVMLPYSIRVSTSYYYVDIARLRGIDHVPHDMRSFVNRLLPAYNRMLDTINGIKTTILTSQFSHIAFCRTNCPTCNIYEEERRIDFFQWSDIIGKPEIQIQKCYVCGSSCTTLQKSIEYYPPIMFVQIPKTKETMFEIYDNSIIQFGIDNYKIRYHLVGTIVQIPDGNYRANVLLGNMWYTFASGNVSDPRLRPPTMLHFIKYAVYYQI